MEPYTALGHPHSGGGGIEEMAPGLLSTKGPHAPVDRVCWSCALGTTPRWSSPPRAPCSGAMGPWWM